MAKEFNDTGTCIPEMHYMVDTSEKLNRIMVDLISKGKYFAINRPRQYGKTTTLYLLSKMINMGDEYVALKISFEGIDEETWESKRDFTKELLEILAGEFNFRNMETISEYIEQKREKVDGMGSLSKLLTEIAKKVKDQSGRKIVLMIDEVDKASNNRLFLDFLGMLRNKYLLRNEGSDYTFHTIILAGVHNVKNLKQKIRPDDEAKYNSPWNIAVDFTVDLAFAPDEIASMLEEYVDDKKADMDISKMSEILYYYTSGYPFLVSKLCKIIDEEIMRGRSGFQWNEKVIEEAVNIILTRKNTNFESLVKNLENNRSLYDLVFDIIINGHKKMYNEDNPVVDKGITHGVFRNDNRLLKIHNRIYEQRIYNYMSSVIDTSISMGSHNASDQFITEDGLDLEFVLERFQIFMKEQYSKKDKDFMERNGRVLFLAFLRPIINGFGYDFKEVEISEEKRLDVVITISNKRYIVELKKWYGSEAHRKGLDQLSDYLERVNQDKGFLIIFHPKKKEWKSERIEHRNKEIFVVWV